MYNSNKLNAYYSCSSQHWKLSVCCTCKVAFLSVRCTRVVAFLAIHYTYVVDFLAVYNYMKLLIYVQRAYIDPLLKLYFVPAKACFNIIVVLCRLVMLC